MTRAQNTERADFELLMRIEMDVEVFGSRWANCDRISGYVARMVSHNRADAVLYANLLSSALNELLETAFRVHDRSGGFVVSMARKGQLDRVELTVPCDDDQRGFYHGAMEMIRRPDVGARYRETLYAAGPLDPRVGLMELAIDYAAEVSVRDAGLRAITLCTDLSLEDSESR